MCAADSDAALSRCELAKTELQMEISNVRMEAASLQDALIKMENLSDGLGQDKADLNQTLMQVAVCPTSLRCSFSLAHFLPGSAQLTNFLRFLLTAR